MKADPNTDGVALNDKGVKETEHKLAGFAGPTTKYGKSMGETGNSGSPKSACELLNSQDDRYGKSRGRK